MRRRSRRTRTQPSNTVNAIVQKTCARREEILCELLLNTGEPGPIDLLNYQHRITQTLFNDGGMELKLDGKVLVIFLPIEVTNEGTDVRIRQAYAVPNPARGADEPLH